MKSGSKLLTSSRDFCQKKTRVRFMHLKLTHLPRDLAHSNEFRELCYSVALFTVITIMIKQHFIVILHCVLLWHLVTTNSLSPWKSCWARPALGWEAKELIWSPKPAGSLTLYSPFHQGATSQQYTSLMRRTQAHICQQRLNKFTLGPPIVLYTGM